MSASFKVVTLCGSTKFKKEFEETQKKLTLDGNIVISLPFFSQSDDSMNNIKLPENKKKMIDDMHKQKIDMADEIFVIDVDGYIGESTKNEIEYALSKEKPIKYYSGKIDISSFKFELFSIIKHLHDNRTGSNETFMDVVKIAIYNKMDKLTKYITTKQQISDSEQKTSETSEWVEIHPEGWCHHTEYITPKIKCKICGFEPKSETMFIDFHGSHERWNKEKYCAGCGRFMVNNTITPLETLIENLEKIGK